MREIKFRGLGIDGGWWFGESTPTGENHINLATFFSNLHVGIIRPNTVGEYTGLRDKNDKEIYEGDVVKSRWGYGNPPQAVDFESMFYWLGESCVDEEHIEVIGNIHENPNLLNKEAPN